MTPQQIFALYEKEREYEKCLFGKYEDIPSLNVASFILFLEAYLKRVKSAYAAKWENELPPWLLQCKEKEQDGNAPVKVYEGLIKILALSGAALEAYTEVDVSKWRQDINADILKWK